LGAAAATDVGLTDGTELTGVCAAAVGVFTTAAGVCVRPTRVCAAVGVCAGDGGGISVIGVSFGAIKVDIGLDGFVFRGVGRVDISVGGVGAAGGAEMNGCGTGR
jgi:hypothetical protein